MERETTAPRSIKELMETDIQKRFSHSARKASIVNPDQFIDHQYETINWRKVYKKLQTLYPSSIKMKNKT